MRVLTVKKKGAKGKVRESKGPIGKLGKNRTKIVRGRSQFLRTQKGTKRFTGNLLGKVGGDPGKDECFEKESKGARKGRDNKRVTEVGGEKSKRGTNRALEWPGWGAGGKG